MQLLPSCAFHGGKQAVCVYAALYARQRAIIIFICTAISVLPFEKYRAQLKNKDAAPMLRSERSRSDRRCSNLPTKFQLITELYDQTVQSVTGSYQSWTGFLRAACYNYKCPFDDQILIYAQRPDATAVLEMERWNRQFGRWVNRGAKSIAVFGDDGQNCLKLYFDVSDTHASRFARPLPIWTMQPGL